jgi:hypothetical protein
MFLVYSVLCYHSFHKKQCIFYVLADLNNSHTILTRIVSQFQFLFKNQNPTTAARLALFLKYRTKIYSCSINFCRISTIHAPFWQEFSRFWICFRNQNPTFVAWTVVILVCTKIAIRGYVSSVIFKPSIFVKSSNYPFSFSGAVLRASSLGCRVAIFILHLLWVVAWAVFNSRCSSL